MLAEYKDKLYFMEDKFGVGGLHPLAPQARFEWNLKKLYIDTEEAAEEESLEQKSEDEN